MDLAHQGFSLPLFLGKLYINESCTLRPAMCVRKVNGINSDSRLTLKDRDRDGKCKNMCFLLINYFILNIDSPKAEFVRIYTCIFHLHLLKTDSNRRLNITSKTLRAAHFISFISVFYTEVSRSAGRKTAELERIALRDWIERFIFFPDHWKRSTTRACTCSETVCRAEQTHKRGE